MIVWLEKFWNWLCHLPWREILARLPLPMLALAASYGVYSYALLFVPEWVAVIQAAAFEATYIGLAVTRGLNPQQRQKATLISVTAVVVSVVYNSLAGMFHRQPELLQNADRLLNSGLAFLHGAPLAIVAYYVSDLLLHSEKQPETAKPETVPPAKQAKPVTLTEVLTPEQLPELPQLTIVSPVSVDGKGCGYCGLPVDGKRLYCNDSHRTLANRLKKQKAG
jgi:hypothetical protein